MTVQRRDNMLAFPAPPSEPPESGKEGAAPEVAGAPADAVVVPDEGTETVVPDISTLGVEAQAERALVLAAQAGDASAFAGLVRRHQRRAYAVARAVVLSHDDAEDAVQEGFLHAFRALARFRLNKRSGRGCTGSWQTLRWTLRGGERCAMRTSCRRRCRLRTAIRRKRTNCAPG